MKVYVIVISEVNGGCNLYNKSMSMRNCIIVIHEVEVQ
jgi:hypothetical protein